MAGIIPTILKPGGGIVLEVGFGQAQTVARELKDAGMGELQITNDLQGVPRVVSGTRIGTQTNFLGLN